MEHTQQENTKTREYINFDDDFEVKFTAINKGLGFYQDSKKAIRPVKKVELEKEVSLEVKPILPVQQAAEPRMASNKQRLMAWFLDCGIVLGTVIITLLAIKSVIELSFAQMLRAWGAGDFVSYLAVLYMTYYMFYFTLLDMRTTPGKYLLGIKTVNNNLSMIKAQQSFMRAFVTLSAGLLLFFPIKSNLQDKLSDTKIINV